MNRKKIIVISIVVFIFILIVVGGIFIFKSKPKTESDADLLGKEPMLPPGPGSSGSPAGSGLSSIPAAFPLKKGMRGPLIANVQKFLKSNSACLNAYKITGASAPDDDGVFGPITEKALKACKGVTEVSQDLYNTMLATPECPPGQYKSPFGCVKIPSLGTPSGSSASSALKAGDPIYAKMPGMVLFLYPTGNSSFGKISTKHDLSKPIGTYTAASSEGFSKIQLTGTEYLINSDGPKGMSGWTTKPTDAYVYTSLIKK